MKEVKRVVSTGFWNDDKVLNLFSPEDRYFMLYILTNPHTTQLGVYHLPLKKAALELGYSVEAVVVLLDRFEKKYGILRYNAETSEVAIKNFLIHSIMKGGKPVLDCLEKEFNSIKDLSLVAYVFKHIDTVDEKYINNTVLEFINNHLDIKDIYVNNNDNENERYVHDSYHDSSKPAKKGKQSVERDVYYPNDELLDKAFRDYVAMRNKIKKPFTTDEAISKSMKKLDSLSGGNNDIAIQILDESVMNSWQGLFPLKEGKRKEPQIDWDNV